MPIIEAMNLGCPVVSANGSLLSEIAKEGVQFFDPLDLDSWISVAELMLDDRLDRVKMIETAKKISSQYTWESTYRETLKIYKKFT